MVTKSPERKKDEERGLAETKKLTRCFGFDAAMCLSASPCRAIRFIRCWPSLASRSAWLRPVRLVKPVSRRFDWLVRGTLRARFERTSRLWAAVRSTSMASPSSS